LIGTQFDEKIYPIGRL